MEVTEEYRRKYQGELDDKIIASFVAPQIKESINLKMFATIILQKLINSNLLQSASNNEIILAELIITIYSSSKTL